MSPPGPRVTAPLTGHVLAIADSARLRLGPTGRASAARSTAYVLVVRFVLVVNAPSSPVSLAFLPPMRESLMGPIREVAVAAADLAVTK